VENVNDNVAKIEQDPSALTPTLLAYALCAIAQQTFFHLIGNRDRPIGQRSGHFALLVSDIEAAAERLRIAGVEFRGPKPRPDGALQIFTSDPDGNTIELCANLPG